MSKQVFVKREPLELPTYPVGTPEKNPMFFEKRVFQGSCGKVYPLPFVDKVYDTPEKKTYDGITLENDFVKLVLLPEIGGRIYIGEDKKNNNYDFFYRNDVIKPALVGLAGPWISGGVEFNWPQHHRPGTFMPTDVSIEHGEDGSVTVWMSEHDPLNRLRGTHGVCLRPDTGLIELKVRLTNRTCQTQTFLWWANVAAYVHEQYESFFPEDVDYVADHAVRAMTEFPYAKDHYYGVNYGARKGKNDLRRYCNIPVPTSYMVCQTNFDFFGGYDHRAEGGFVHVADRYIAPGKKQWTWGNHPFGYAWDRELTDKDGPYVELMAGVYTDNQPDFTYLLPYETRTFSQYWWPYQKIGSVQNANHRVAIRLTKADDNKVDAGVVVCEELPGAQITFSKDGKILKSWKQDLTPESPWYDSKMAFDVEKVEGIVLSVADQNGKELLSYQLLPPHHTPQDKRRALATEPPAPEEIKSSDELFLTAEHLEQNRHPTRMPELYLNELLKRDPGDSRGNLAMGRRCFRRGEFEKAAEYLTRAVKRLTFRHPNPYTGEAHYYLGLTRFYQGREEEAYAGFYKSVWDGAWRAPGFYSLALIDCRRKDWKAALEHFESSLDADRRNGKAIALKAVVLKKLGRVEEAEKSLKEHLAQDPLDHLVRWESGDTEGMLSIARNDVQTILDLVFDYAEAGFYAEAEKLILAHDQASLPACAVPNPLGSSATLMAYTAAWIRENCEAGSSKKLLEKARSLSADWFFPSRLQEMLVLEWAVAQPGADRNAAYGLGNMLYDKGRREEALVYWEKAAEADPSFPTVWRNLGIAYWNVKGDAKTALQNYKRAMELLPSDARLVAEYDQLCGKAGVDPKVRLAFLQKHVDLVEKRDDCSVQMATLFNTVGQSDKALELLCSRHFHPWEGGEGKVLRQYTQAHLLLGRKALEEKDFATALHHAEQAMDTPKNLGEAYHLLQAKADVCWLRGSALRGLGREEEACQAFEEAVAETGDFVAMAVAAHSELSYWRGLSMIALGRYEQARVFFEDVKQYAEKQLRTPAKIDYFATSLPLLLVFEDDLEAVKNATANKLLDLAIKGLELAEKKGQEK